MPPIVSSIESLNNMMRTMKQAKYSLKAQVEKDEGPSGEGQSPRVEKDEGPSGEG